MESIYVILAAAKEVNLASKVPLLIVVKACSSVRPKTCAIVFSFKNEMCSSNIVPSRSFTPILLAQIILSLESRAHTRNADSGCELPKTMQMPQKPYKHTHHHQLFRAFCFFIRAFSAMFQIIVQKKLRASFFD
jgi:hypothetical protein